MALSKISIVQNPKDLSSYVHLIDDSGNASQYNLSQEQFGKLSQLFPVERSYSPMLYGKGNLPSYDVIRQAAQSPMAYNLDNVPGASGGAIDSVRAIRQKLQGVDWNALGTSPQGDFVMQPTPPTSQTALGQNLMAQNTSLSGGQPISPQVTQNLQTLNPPMQAPAAPVSPATYSAASVPQDDAPQTPQLGGKILNPAQLQSLAKQGLTEADILRIGPTGEVLPPGQGGGTIYLKANSRFNVGGTGQGITPATPQTQGQQMATLINAQGQKVVVPVGSQLAQQYFGQGYTLMGSSSDQTQGGGSSQQQNPAGSSSPIDPVIGASVKAADASLNPQTPQSFYDTQLQQIKDLFSPSASENTLEKQIIDENKKLNDLYNKTQLQKLDEASQGIATPFVYGQQAATEAQAAQIAGLEQNKIQSLKDQMSYEQAKRTAALDANKFVLDQEMKMREPIKLSAGESLGQYNPITGKYEQIAQAPGKTQDDALTLIGKIFAANPGDYNSAIDAINKIPGLWAKAGIANPSDISQGFGGGVGSGGLGENGNMEASQFNRPNELIARTDRSNNPTAMTTDIAKQGGLVLGKDYIQGDPFVGEDGKTYYTAKLIGDNINKTIKVIDKIGFTKKDGSLRWSYTNSIPGANNKDWPTLSRNNKMLVMGQMYQREGGWRMKDFFPGATELASQSQSSLGTKYSLASLPEFNAAYVTDPTKGHTVPQVQQNFGAAVEANLDMYGRPRQFNESALQGQNPGIQAWVRAITQYRVPLPNAPFFIKTPFGQKINELLYKYAPDYDGTVYDARLDARKNFVNGEAGSNIKALNTAIGHLWSLRKAFDANANTGLKPLNIALNWYKEQTNSGYFRAKTINTLGAVASELANVFKSSGATDNEIEQFGLKNVSENATPATMYGYIDSALELMQSRTDAIQNQWHTAMWTNKDYPVLSPEASKILADFNTSGGGTNLGRGNSSQVAYNQNAGEGYNLPH